jgi:hypothetical protein
MGGSVRGMGAWLKNCTGYFLASQGVGEAKEMDRMDRRQGEDCVANFGNNLFGFKLNI